MIKLINKIVVPLITRRQTAYWKSAADSINEITPSELSALRREAKKLSSILTKFTDASNEALAVPALHSTPTRKSRNANWSYRPLLWSSKISPKGHTSLNPKTILNTESQVFHDSKISELSVRQSRNHKRSHLAPYGVVFDVMGFNGTYLSLMVELPKIILTKATKDHVLSIALLLESEHPCEMYARLNFQNGPNTHNMVQDIPLRKTDITCDFDLYFSEFKPESTSKIWIDLIFKDPIMNEIIIRDCCINTHTRATI